MSAYWLAAFVSGLFLVATGCVHWDAERKAPVIGEFVEVNGAQLHVVDIGPKESAKAPVVLIHGASVNLRDMKIALGDVLAQDRRVIMIDRPGRGYSERPMNGYELDVQAQYIRSAVSALDVEAPIIVGQSFGGAVALSYALQYQEEMAGLVLLAPVSHEWPGGVAWYNNASQIPVLGFLLRRFLIPPFGYLTLDDSIDDSFSPDETPPEYVARAGLPLLFRPKDFKSNAEDLANLKQEIIKQQDHYGELVLPVAIVTGEADTTVSPEIHAKTLVGEIDGATLLLLPKTGHALHHSQTARIASVIDEINARAQP